MDFLLACSSPIRDCTNSNDCGGDSYGRRDVHHVLVHNFFMENSDMLRNNPPISLWLLRSGLARMSNCNSVPSLMAAVVPKMCL